MKIQLQQVRWLARNWFFLHSICLVRARTNEPDMSRLMQQVRDNSQKLVESVSQTRTNLSKTWSQTRFSTRFAAS